MWGRGRGDEGIQVGVAERCCDSGGRCCGTSGVANAIHRMVIRGEITVAANADTNCSGWIDVQLVADVLP